jgi:hypothetical protein
MRAIELSFHIRSITGTDGSLVPVYPSWNHVRRASLSNLALTTRQPDSLEMKTCILRGHNASMISEEGTSERV